VEIKIDKNKREHKQKTDKITTWTLYVDCSVCLSLSL
jgi:hypothetical protein